MCLRHEKHKPGIFFSRDFMFGLRKYFLLDPSITFLNHGSFGATPRPVMEELRRWQHELERQPVEFLARRHDELMQTSRRALAGYLHTGPDDLVYTQNVTIALNIVARSLELNPGDEVLTTDHEYGACDRMWRFLSRERGFQYVRRPLPVPIPSEADFPEVFWQGITPRTRVIFISHITSSTAILLPLMEVCRRARRQGILTIVDGAHGPGQIDLDLSALGADFYGGNLHKWLCAPKGAGFLYARPEVQSLLKPLVVSWGYEPDQPGPSQLIDHHQWWGTRDVAAFLSVPAAIQFKAEHDWPRVRLACHELARRAQQAIRSLTGLPSLYSGDSGYVQMFSAFLPPEVELSELKKRLYEEARIEVPLMEWNGHRLIRVSIQGYNTVRDVHRLIEALDRLL